MTEHRIAASPAELQALAEAIMEKNAADAEAERAGEIVKRCFVLFAEGKGVSGAMLVGIEQGQVVVALPEESGPALVPSEPAA